VLLSRTTKSGAPRSGAHDQRAGRPSAPWTAEPSLCRRRRHRQRPLAGTTIHPGKPGDLDKAVLSVFSGRPYSRPPPAPHVAGATARGHRPSPAEPGSTDDAITHPNPSDALPAQNSQFRGSSLPWEDRLIVAQIEPSSRGRSVVARPSRPSRLGNGRPWTEERLRARRRYLSRRRVSRLVRARCSIAEIAGAGDRCRCGRMDPGRWCALTPRVTAALNSVPRRGRRAGATGTPAQPARPPRRCPRGRDGRRRCHCAHVLAG